MQSFEAKNGAAILRAMVDAIQSNKAYLGEIDGLIGDGDHGMNMNKGFSMFGERFLLGEISFTEGLCELGGVLLNEIGGSMGPIYGTVFMDMANAGEGVERIGLGEFTQMLRAGMLGLFDIVDAKVGDKTLVDTLAPAVDALECANVSAKPFGEALDDMKAAAKKGSESTKGLVAKFGRSSRLGERSRGGLDAGAVSCCILLIAMADGIASQFS